MSEQWQWQQSGTAWHGVGIYHVTLVVPSREPLLGELVIPDNDPRQAKVIPSPFGRTLLNMLWDLPNYQPDIQVLHYGLMPDHLHMVWYVRKHIDATIRAAVQGFWQGAKKLGRAYSFKDSSFDPTNSRHNFQESLRDELGNDMYSHLDPIFTEQPFIRPMGQRRQLPTTIRYIDMNPQRLATKRLMPGFFCVQHDVELAGRNYDAIGNIKILQADKFAPVHVRSIWVDDAEQHGDDTKLRDYKNGCILAARQGTVMVSPFISPHEKAVLDYLLKEHHSIIYIADNGFGEYYKPASAFFDAVADGRMLILSPWQHDPEKKHVTRAECVAMNKMAEDICSLFKIT